MPADLAHGGRTYDLDRWPVRQSDPWRAWDTADQYLLDAVGAPTASRLLVVNDRFGALSVPLAGHRPVLWSDSYLTRLAVDHNLGANGCDPSLVTFVPADVQPAGTFGLVLARFPKSLTFWEDSLRRLRPHLAPGARVLAGGMIKHTPRRAYELLERLIGPTRTSLGWKKARLAEAEFAPERDPPPAAPEVAYELAGCGITLVGGPNVFAREHLDPGTRALLPWLPEGRVGQFADLGCGNGALALALALRNPAAAVLAVDESYQAVAAARANAARAGLGAARVRCEVADGLAKVPPGTLDLVACNPPFHQDRAVGDALAWRMFTQAHRALVVGGRLLVVGNRHLAHGGRLTRIFGNARRLAQTDRFEVLEAART
ncbi:MAG: methyltransferase [Candidatus Krumholzibacteriia bacterium]